jgi:hypothetical protein
MEKKASDLYTKHIYWLTEKEEKALRQAMADQKRRLPAAKGVVCTPLDPINKIASVAPEIWDDTCSRQGSWYRHSPKNGLFLVVSSFELESFRHKREAIITVSDFVPPRLATEEEKNDLVNSTRLQKSMPEEWRHVGDTEKRIYLRWAKRLGSDVREYEFLYRSHTANHANFMQPRFFIRDEAAIVPYSIDRSAHLCSCCLELFQILGDQHRKKLVAPCPGATIFARLKPDRYLQVERP